MALSQRLYYAKLDKAEREASQAIDLADRALQRNHPRAEEFLARAEAKLAEWDRLLGKQGWPVQR